MKKYFKKNKKNFLSANRQGGAAMLIAIVFFLFISLAIISGLVSPSIREFKNANVNLNSKKSFFLSESGSEDASYRIFRKKTISENETINLDSNSVVTTITNFLGNIKEIISLGDVSSYQRKTGLTLKTGGGIIFKYGIQAGQGGFVFQNNSYVNGSIYSNGNIVGSNGAYITGDAFVAGDNGLIFNMRIGSNGIGNARAHTVMDSTVTGTIYCQNGFGNNSPCDTSQPDPTIQDLPISDFDIAEWENDATSGGTTDGSVIVSAPATIGPTKIIGDLTVNSILTVAGTIYATGNIIINGTVKLKSVYGATSGVIMSEGYIIINNGVVFQDSGTAGSYILFLSKSTCDASILYSPCNGNNAIQVGNNSSISIVNAQKGTVYFSNNASVKEVVGNTIFLKNNVGINYGSGIIKASFTERSSNSWVIGGWGEK